MIIKNKVNTVVKSVKGIDSIKENLVPIFKIEGLQDYTWEFNNDTFEIKSNNKTVYREANQHVTAVAKLLRMPKEIWLLWANLVLIYSENKIKKLKTKDKINLFNQAFKASIELYLSEKTVQAKLVKEKCLNCGKASFSKPLTRSVLNRDFSVQICKSCGLGIRNPRPTSEQLHKIYSEEEYFGGDTTERGYFDYASEAPWRIDKAFRYLEKLEKVANINPNTSKVLDIGSGYGYFLKALQDKGYSNLGIELAPDAVDFAQKNYGVETLTGDVPSLMKSNDIVEKSFDLITLWDVVEHFYDFNDDLELIVKLLNKGGYVALRTNNIASVEFEVFGKYFHSIKYEHTFYYTQQSLKEIFQKFGVKEVSTWTHTHLFLAFMSQEEINTINQKNQGGDIFFVGQKT